MKINTTGLILSEKTIGENDKLVCVLTADKGVLRCFVRGAKSFKNHNNSAVQSLCYSRLSIFEGREKYIIDEAVPIRIFYELRRDLESLSLAQYLSELAMYMVPENSESSEPLSLLLNSLHMIAGSRRPPLMIKAVYEMRILTLTGFMPNLIYCDKCGCYEAEQMYYIQGENKLICQNCCTARDERYLSVSRPVLLAMRHSIFAEPKKIFSFRLSEQAVRSFADTAETILLYVTERQFNSLQFFKTIVNGLL